MRGRTGTVDARGGSKFSTPAGVTEAQYRRALEAIRSSSAQDKAVSSTGVGNNHNNNNNSITISNNLNNSNNNGAKAIDAAALQSNLARRYNLPGAHQRRNIAVRPAAVQPQAKVQTSEVNSSTTAGTATYANTHNNSTRTGNLPPCACCGARSDPKQHESAHLHRDFCRDCGYYLLDAFVRDHESTNLSVLRGLIKAPEKHQAVLSLDQWAAIEAKLEDRVDAYCSICMVGFNQNYEVLLSCSHMFHRACLHSFEKFAKSGSSKACPICRTQDYQKKITRIGSRAFNIVCAIRIQSIFRGYLARQRYHVGLRSYYRLGKGDCRQRKRFYEKELSHLTNGIAREVEVRKGEVDSVLSSTDVTLQESRQLELLFDQMVLHRQLERQHAGYGGYPDEGKGNDESDFNANDGSTISRSDYRNEEYYTSFERGYNEELSLPKEQTVEVMVSGEQWQDIIHTAITRGLGECAICMLTNQTLVPSYSRSLYVLSCSHIFHVPCVDNLEKFVKSTQQKLCCPVCRSQYAKRKLS